MSNRAGGRHGAADDHSGRSGGSRSTGSGNGAHHGTSGDSDGIVDWDLAFTTASRLLRPGPDVGREEARAVVAELRDFARVAETHVREYTGMDASGGRAPVLVVDRPGWVQANVDAFREVLQPLAEKLRARRGPGSGRGDAGQMGPPLGSFGARITGVEAGALLAFLSNKVLGQFDPFWTDPAAGSQGRTTPVPAPRTHADAARSGERRQPDSAADESRGSDETSPTSGGDSATELEQAESTLGRLLLVAPNVVQIERELGVDPHDFRLWVCIHEETHRVQFTAVPWLRDHLRGEIRSFLEQTDLDPSAMFSQLRNGIEQVGRIVRGDGDEVSLLDLVQTPRQREIIDRVTAIMSLLEGHAEVVMDGVGPEVIPTVATIRERFQRRRSGGTWVDHLLKRLLGLDAKLRQYRDGAAFVRSVVAAVGQEGFNRVWESPDHLPTKAEIADPAAWVRRVHARGGSNGATSQEPGQGR